MYITYAVLYELILLLSVKLMSPALSPDQSSNVVYCTLFWTLDFLRFYILPLIQSQLLQITSIILSGAIQEATMPLSQAPHWLLVSIQSPLGRQIKKNIECHILTHRSIYQYNQVLMQNPSRPDTDDPF
jgi:hypothetical protein